MNADQRRLDDITEKVIGCAYNVANALGSGFLEKVYENALAHELRKSGLAVQQQKHVSVIYDGIVVGDYTADLLVQESVVVELKTAKTLEDIHIAQCLNYLQLWQPQGSDQTPGEPVLTGCQPPVNATDAAAGVTSAFIGVDRRCREKPGPSISAAASGRRGATPS